MQSSSVTRYNYKTISHCLNHDLAFQNFTLCCVIRDVAQVKQTALTLVMGNKAEGKLEGLLNMESAKDLNKLPCETDGSSGFIEMIISSSSVDIAAKENACREVFKYSAIDIMTLVLKNEQVLIDRSPSIGPSLPDPINQLNYLRKMDFTVIKTMTPKRYHACKWFLQMKQAQVLCKSIEESQIVVPSVENLVVAMRNSVYIKTNENAIEAVVKEMEVEKGSYLIILGRQSSLISNDLWLNVQKTLKANLKNEFGNCHGFQLQQVLPRNEDFVTTDPIEDTKCHEKSGKIHHCCQETSSGK